LHQISESAGFYLGFNFRGCNPKAGVPSLPCPFPLPSPTPFPPLPVPPLALEVGPLKTSYGGLGSAVSSPSGVWGGAPAEIEFGAF